MKGRDSKGRFISGEDHPMKTKEMQDIVGIALKGKKPWNTGKGGTYKLKLSGLGLQRKQNSCRNRIWTNESREKVSKARKGKSLKIEHKLKLKIARRHRFIPKYDTIPERILEIGLILNEIKFQKHKQTIEGYPDFFIEPNICVFVDGDYVHGNPRKYKPESIIMGRKRAIDKWIYDNKKTMFLINNGYKVVRLWESDIKKNVQIGIDVIKRVIRI